MHAARLVAFAALIVTLALPAAATGAKPDVVGPKAAAGAKAKAYGRYCKGQSKKHVAGAKGTPFSQCVTAMAKLASGKSAAPKKACRGLSKERIEGTNESAFSRCVKGGTQLLEDGGSG